MDMERFNTNNYIGKTATTPRPSPETYKGPHEAMARDQERWDFAKSWDDDNVQLKAARLAEVDARREQTLAELRAEREAEFVERLRRNYFASDPGATEAEFARDLPDIRRKHRIDAALEPPVAALSKYGPM